MLTISTRFFITLYFLILFFANLVQADSIRTAKATISEPISSKQDQSARIKWNLKQSNKSYLDGLKKLYLTHNSKKALLLEINRLLFVNHYEPGRIRIAGVKKGIFYSVTLVKNNLFISETRYAKNGNTSVEVSKFDVFGIDPFIRYGCDYDKYACWLFDPVDHTTHWITIGRNNQAAKALAQALSVLMQLIQKG